MDKSYIEQMELREIDALLTDAGLRLTVSRGWGTNPYNARVEQHVTDACRRGIGRVGDSLLDAVANVIAAADDAGWLYGTLEKQA